MDNVFSEIKSRLAMPEVARFYGLEMNRAGMACYPFHDDKTPILRFTTITSIGSVAGLIFGSLKNARQSKVDMTMIRVGGVNGRTEETNRRSLR